MGRPHNECRMARLRFTQPILRHLRLPTIDTREPMHVRDQRHTHASPHYFTLSLHVSARLALRSTPPCGRPKRRRTRSHAGAFVPSTREGPAAPVIARCHATPRPHPGCVAVVATPATAPVGATLQSEALKGKINAVERERNKGSDRTHEDAHPLTRTPTRTHTHTHTHTHTQNTHTHYTLQPSNAITRAERRGLIGISRLKRTRMCILGPETPPRRRHEAHVTRCTRETAEAPTATGASETPRD